MHSHVISYHSYSNPPPEVVLSILFIYTSKLAEGHGILIESESKAHTHSNKNMVLHFQDQKRSLCVLVEWERGFLREKSQGRK